MKKIYYLFGLMGLLAVSGCQTAGSPPHEVGAHSGGTYEAGYHSSGHVQAAVMPSALEDYRNILADPGPF